MLHLSYGCKDQISRSNRFNSDHSDSSPARSKRCIKIITCDSHPSGLYNVEEVVSTNINKINELISSLVPMQ